MSLTNWLRKVVSGTPRKTPPQAVRGPRSRWTGYRPLLESLEDCLTPTTQISFDAIAHALNINVGGVNETATLSVSGTNLSVTSDQGTTSDGSLGFASFTLANQPNTGSIAAANDVRQLIVTGAGNNESVIFQGGTFPALTMADGTIANGTFNTAASTFAMISSLAANADVDVAVANGITLGQNLVTQNGGSVTLEATNGTTVTGANILVQASPGGDIGFEGPINGATAGGQNLTLLAGPTNTVELATAVGFATPLASLTVSAGAIDVVGGVETTGPQSYTGATTLNTSQEFVITIVSSGTTEGNVPFNGSLMTTGAAR